jgi:hypothetical protein
MLDSREVCYTDFSTGNTTSYSTVTDFAKLRG